MPTEQLPSPLDDDDDDEEEEEEKEKEEEYDDDFKHALSDYSCLQDLFFPFGIYESSSCPVSS